MNISVIIPAYNEEKYIQACLESLALQTILPSELIVVNNNSSDKTEKIAKKMGAVVVHETKQGMIYARNRGFDYATTNLIARCDADVIVPKNWIETIIYDFENYKIDALTGPVAYNDLINGKLVDPTNIYSKIIKFLLKGNDVLLGPNMIITKSIWQRVRNFVCLDDRLILEDIDLSINIIRNGGKIMRDDNLKVLTSARRIKNNPKSFFFVYPYRSIRTFLLNRNG